MGTACARVGVLLVVCGVGVTAAAPQTAAPAPAIEPGAPAEAAAGGFAAFAADGAFARVLDRMWERSPTFRQQCRRLALGAPRVRVRLRLETTASTSIRARSVVEWRGGAVASVSMHVPIGPAMEELIAHEVEHVLEQVDHVDLESHVASGVAWRQGRDAFETRRAIEAGRRVAAEVTAFRQQAGRR